MCVRVVTHTYDIPSSVCVKSVLRDGTPPIVSFPAVLTPHNKKQHTSYVTKAHQQAHTSITTDDLHIIGTSRRFVCKSASQGIYERVLYVL